MHASMEGAMAHNNQYNLPTIEVTSEQRAALERWTRRRTTAAGLAQRARIVLLTADGLSHSEVAEKVGCHTSTVGKWRARFAREGLDGLLDEPRPGRPRLIGDDKVEAVIVKTLEQQPTDATHWSTRSMAKATGMSQSAVSRIWRAFGLQPHRTETFKLSNDPLFVEKVRDIVGLYLDPPDRAVVLCVDEKTQVQAIDRTQPILPMRPGTPERRTHDYRRYGITSLFAALNVATGQVFGQVRRRHRSSEFLAFLKTIDTNVPASLDVHLVLDNQSTHKTPAVHRWLVRHPRFHVHFTPTYSSWINLVERWFAELTTKWITRGTHRSVRELERSLREWIEMWNDDPRPFVWTKTADEILEKLAKYCRAISDSGH
jgi:transposase